MFKHLIVLLFIVWLLVPTNVAAQEHYGASASLKGDSNEVNYDMRVTELREYLESHNSPLAEYAEDFIKYSDQYDLDWRLVPAITGVESTFGKHIPYNSYNAYGWANGNYSFSSWEESIGHVSKTLAEKYIAKGANTSSEIGRIYAPPSSTWSSKVEYFKNKIEPLPVEFAL